MYSKARAVRMQTDAITPPPGYGGSRFGNGTDGEMYPRQSDRDRDLPRMHEKAQPCDEEKTPCEKGKTSSCEPLGFLKNIDKEELLIIGLIILLAGERAESDTLLLLILLLCI